MGEVWKLPSTELCRQVDGGDRRGYGIIILSDRGLIEGQWRRSRHCWRCRVFITTSFARERERKWVL